jgi:DmsE family decaheme c-type cytochrome
MLNCTQFIRGTEQYLPESEPPRTVMPMARLRHALFLPVAFAIGAIPSIAAQGGASKWKSDIECAACHDDLVLRFRPTPHGKALEFGNSSSELTCASCHRGDLAKHVENTDVLPSNPGKDKPGVSAETCLSCHANQKNLMFWRGSQHQTSGNGCLTCHSIHKAGTEHASLAKKSEAETCFACHGNIRRAMLQRSTHLFRDERGERRLECASCHNPHGAPTEKLIRANSINDQCYSCHQEKRGPFLWEHAPVRESCVTCHTPHGSNNPGLLALRTPQLCQSCHIQGRHQTVAGRPNAMWNINRSCLNCHSQIHGTNHPSGPILQR